MIMPSSTKQTLGDELSYHSNHIVDLINENGVIIDVVCWTNKAQVIQKSCHPKWGVCFETNIFYIK